MCRPAAVRSGGGEVADDGAERGLAHGVTPARQVQDFERRVSSWHPVGSSRHIDEGGAAMATIPNVKTPRPLAGTAKWAEPVSKSVALFARAQGVLPGGNSR